MVSLFTTTVKIPPKEVIRRIRANSKSFDFVVREVFDMNEQFSNHGVEVNEDWEFYSVMVCNPPRAYSTILANPLRGAILLPPKQIVIYKDKKSDVTIVAYLKFDKDSVGELLPNDLKFQEGLSNSCNKIVSLIEFVTKT